eukprot:TRINITY_DN74372_c0_g1_i1.p1 TRINITY_DN74372_c0_g1~~TRINITY_DN74372_c0_g1_i1.p1  ORF type:complete len:470 (+),score=59.66 TRINITY_DN74372_c0_g1_i1:127-1536(+)
MRAFVCANVLALVTSSGVRPDPDELDGYSSDYEQDDLDILSISPRVIVRFTETVASSAADVDEQSKSMKKRPGVKKVVPLEHLGMAVLSVTSIQAEERLLHDLATVTNVEVAVPDSILVADFREERRNSKATAKQSYQKRADMSESKYPNDPLFDELWGMSNSFGSSIHAPEAWAETTGNTSASIIVGVMDTGIDYRHVDLRDRMWSNPNEIPGNGIDDDGNGIVDDVHGANFAMNDGDPMDDARSSHGTHVAGTIAATGDNDIGVTGVSWKGVQLMALKFLQRDGRGRTSDAVEAVNYAVANNAKILSASFGSRSPNSALRAAIARAGAAGVLFVSSAGNNGRNSDHFSHFPSNYKTKNMINVASTTSRGRLSSFSNYGPTTVMVAAPGSNILSTVRQNRYGEMSGTSMAVPHVSGLAALIWMFRPNLSVHQVKDTILKSVVKLRPLEGRIVTEGIIDAQRALALLKR